MVAEPGWLRVPVGPEADGWTTRRNTARVLLVVHNVTSATRLLDVLPLFDGDLRVQCLVTCTGSSPFSGGVPELLSGLGLPVLPWAQAKATPVDLAVSASYGGELPCIQGELIVLSHGVGYNKRLTASREPRAASREPRAASREPRAASREPSGSVEPRRPPESAPPPAFGMGPEWLLHDGRPIASATVLSHPEQFDRLKAACPQAAETAVLAGDPCFDRLLAAARYRPRFRHALGLAPGQRLVLLNSTWNPGALFGDRDDDPLPELLSRLATELPRDEYRVAAVLHPNIWNGHGHGQVRRWLEPARRAGLALVDPLGDWRQALIAADCVIGDHGSVTYYGAALGRPVLLGAFPDGDLDPHSPVATLGRLAPRLHPSQPLRPQLDRLVTTHDPERYAHLTALTTSSPGESAALLRRAFYELIGLPEPPHPAVVDRLPLPGSIAAPATAPLRAHTRVRHPSADGRTAAPQPPPTTTGDRPMPSADRPPPTVHVTRHVQGPAVPVEPPGAEAAHTVVHEDTADLSRLALADVVVQYAPAHRPGPPAPHPDGDRLGPATAWTSEALALYPECALAAYVTGPDRCTVRTANGQVLHLAASPHPDGRPDLCDPAVYASALYAWWEHSGLGPGEPPEALAGTGLLVVTGDATHRVSVTPESHPLTST